MESMDATSEFSKNVSQKRHLTLLEKLEGVVRFDITTGKKTEQIPVRIDHGDIQVVSETTKADCVVTTDRALFNDILQGDENLMAAMIRGAVQIDGDPRYIVPLRRLLPSSSNSLELKRGADERESR